MSARRRLVCVALAGHVGSVTGGLVAQVSLVACVALGVACLAILSYAAKKRVLPRDRNYWIALAVGALSDNLVPTVSFRMMTGAAALVVLLVLMQTTPKAAARAAH